MKLLLVITLIAGILGTGSVFLLGGAGLPPSSATDSASPVQPAKIAIDYPLQGSVFPPEITPPTFRWRDSSGAATRWVIEVSFADRSAAIRVEAPGELLRMGELDPQVGPPNELNQLTPEQAATRTWKPDADTWNRIKRQSVKAPATIGITGFVDDFLKTPVSGGSVNIATSVDPVGAPIFYRDVPLMMWPKEQKGSIQPLPPFAIPLIKWKLRNISEPQSHTVMENLPTCGNCHSFSLDGKTLGMDLDGPKNDKGLYAIVSVSKDMIIRNQDVIRWSSLQDDPTAKTSEPAVKRFGFMSQVSPDGRYVVSSIGPPGLGNAHQKELPDFAAGLADRLYSMNFKGPPFNQVFYPTRGILAWYDRKEQKLRPLPGANDPRFVQTSAFWSPDGKYLVFSRAAARDPYPADAPKAEYANDPNETQIQYDLYRIPFNEGKGGKAEPVLGASGNGMSNNFPKVSPDGRWIVFVQNHNGLLMRPDSKLYIVPFAGGKARLMTCNTSLMNSWHTFSPNGRWLAFSSKAFSPYTRLMLTHIDANGNDTPPILVDDTTAANRAVNIPEFVNVAPGGLEKIDPQATEFYRLFNQAYDLIENNKWPEAIPVLRQALEKDPDFAVAHYGLATALLANGQEGEALEEYRKACTLETDHPAWFDHLAVLQARNGDLDGAIDSLQKSLALDPSDAGTEDNLGTILFEKGQGEPGSAHLRKAIQMAPDFADPHNHLGWELSKTGQLDEAIAELQEAIKLRPSSVEYHVNLGYVLAQRRDFAGAVPVFEKAVELSDGKDWRCLDMLASVYEQIGRAADAVRSEQQAVSLAAQEHDEPLEKNLQVNLERYEHEVVH
ncbi:MAG TPA: tetratricopeptide repeat protein [Terriglobales bacterium]